MHQTTYGETLKTKVLDRSQIDSFLKENKDIFFEIKKNNTSCLYREKEVISDSALNYLNLESNHSYIKDVLKKEYDVCESIYPFLGDVFIDIFFNDSKNKKNFFLFSKDKEKIFLNSLKNNLVKDIGKYIFDNGSLDYNVFINKHQGCDVIVEKKENVQFDFEFDYDYFKIIKEIKVKNYNFVLIEGIIDTMGEIHHLLYNAALNKEHYVVFCLGVNQEVKNNVIVNNQKGITNVHIIDIESSEKTLNILNDIALVHNANIISAFKGETISQEIKKGLDVGKEITISKNKIVIKPVCSKVDIKLHKNFLIKRIKESQNNENKKLLEARYKSISNKNIEVFLPEILLSDTSFKREIDYLFRFMANVKHPMQSINIDRKKYYIPKSYVKMIEKKSKNLKNMFKNIEKLIVFKN